MTEVSAKGRTQPGPADADTIGIVLHHHRDEVRDLAERALTWCEKTGVAVRLPAEDAALLGRDDLGVATNEMGPGLVMCLSIGGDGTMLRAVELSALHGVPVLGVNAGRLGYLTEFMPQELEESLDRWRDDDLETQERMLLEVTVVDNGSTSIALALNEVVLTSAINTHSVSVDTDISGKRFTTHLADGVIVATPTGSTAYSLSAGGPVVEPEFEALVLTPVASHMVFDRSLILAPSTEVRLTVSGYRAGTVAVDGRAVAELEPGGSIVCRASETRARFLVRGDRDFHTVLKDKFGLSDRNG